ncbi:serine/threonine-protein kinase [Rhizohabitans arisaemae]|uniref:serine/threonine-protein kinase n=1 Tax=Rhizohabitans arisaemae TaxID=2720610 RepID=UPI0024B1B174|nr:serine/threonine-protein kinase [Rhizohabitans arisaemae]
MQEHWSVPGYSEIRELGAGASGRVVLAEHVTGEVPVAIKYLSGKLRDDDDFLGRFRAEARMMIRLDDPHVARLYEYVESDAGAAIVMELVDGVSLRMLLGSEGPTGPEAALTVLKGSLLGLAAAHARGVVHRDYKPENVMVEQDGTTKLVDFGIASRSGEQADTAGTPAYMAPEQWAGTPAGPSTDVYAATAVFFECLTGTRPYRSQHLAALARQHQVAPVPIEEVPPPLQPIIAQGLAKNPADRPRDARAFVNLLESVALAGYGPDWEDRGRRRLAGSAGLLAALFPLSSEPGPAGGTTVGVTELTQAGAATRRFLGANAVKIAVGVGTLAVAATVITVLATSGGSPELRSADRLIQATDPAPTLPTVEPAVSDEPTSEEPTESPEPTPSTAPSTSAAPTTKPPQLAPTASQSPTPTPKPTPRPTPSRTPSPTPSAEPPVVTEPPPRPRPPRPTPTPTPTTPSPTPPTTTPPDPSSPPGTPD